MHLVFTHENQQPLRQQLRAAHQVVPALAHGCCRLPPAQVMEGNAVRCESSQTQEGAFGGGSSAQGSCHVSFVLQQADASGPKCHAVQNDHQHTTPVASHARCWLRSSNHCGASTTKLMRSPLLYVQEAEDPHHRSIRQHADVGAACTHICWQGGVCGHRLCHSALCLLPQLQ